MDISIIDFKATMDRLNSLKLKSVWNNAVRDYAGELLENVSDALEWYRSENESTILPLVEACFNTKAYNESDFAIALRCSEGGCFLIYDEEIAQKLCTKSELKSVTRKDGSLRDRPNSGENWIQCQGRALFQAYRMLKDNLVLTE